MASAALPMHIAQTNPEPAPDPGEAGEGQANEAKIQGVQDDLFAGTEKFAKGASDATEVNMDPDSLAMVNGSDAKRAHNMVLNVVRTYEYDKPGMYRMEDVEEFRRKLTTGDWHCSIHSRDLKTGESTDICNKHRTDGLIESAIITVEPKQLTFIHTIRRASGGSSLILPGMGVLLDGMGAELAGLGPNLGPELASIGPVMKVLQPEIDAEIKGAMADMHAHEPEMAGLQIKLPKIDTRMLEQQLQEAQRRMKVPSVDSRELDKELQDLQRRIALPSASIPNPQHELSCHH